MNFLLKIVGGPNNGAEIALVSGVAVTLGKGDDSDIVLADPTMPDEPLTLLASEDGVAVGGEPLAQFRVKTVGATSFAVGPADAQWEDLSWPVNAKEKDPDTEPKGEGAEPEADGRGDGVHPNASRPEPDEEKPVPPARRRGCMGCLAVLLVLLAAMAIPAWLYRGQMREVDWQGVARSARGHADSASSYLRSLCGLCPQGGAALDVPAPDRGAVAAKYGLSISKCDGVARMSGNLKTRRDRLAATAEAYAAQPGVDLDLTDDESLHASAEDALFTLTEGALKLSSATNRFLRIVGRSPSAVALKKTLTALNADMPKLRGVDVSGVTFGHVRVSREVAADAGGVQLPVHRAQSNKTALPPSLPVCGILTTPYPCLIARDGRRYLEGAAIGGNVIVKIGVDSVVLTNSTGRFTWKP